MDTWLLDLWLAHPRLIIATGLILLALAYRQILWFCGIIMVPNDSVGVVTKKFSLFGKHRDLPDGSIIALHGEAGYQADTLTPGLHFSLWPLQYAVELVKFLTIPPGKVGCVEACDGREALDRLREMDQADIVLVDWNMPEVAMRKANRSRVNRLHSENAHSVQTIPWSLPIKLPWPHFFRNRGNTVRRKSCFVVHLEFFRGPTDPSIMRLPLR